MVRNLLCMMALAGGFLLPLAPPAEAAKSCRPPITYSSPLYAPLLLPVYVPLLLLPPVPTHHR